MNLRRDHILTPEAIFHVVVFAVSVTALLLAYAALGKPAGQVPLVGGNDVHVVPASGVDGFNTAVFCADPLTKVRLFPSPDSAGKTYQLTRVRDNVTESVVYVLNPDDSTRLATHYYDSSVGQQSGPAVITQEARDCIAKKAGK